MIKQADINQFPQDFRPTILVRHWNLFTQTNILENTNLNLKAAGLLSLFRIKQMYMKSTLFSP